jgi:uncharacterized spore protein YtfJ
VISITEEVGMSETPSAPRPRGAELLATLAERVGAQLKSETVYGPPVERDGVTVVPVAAPRFGIGAGSGVDPSKHQEGEGGGAGGTITPTGYIEIKDGRTRYVPIVRPARMAALLAGTLLAAAVILRPKQRTRRWPLAR